MIIIFTLLGLGCLGGGIAAIVDGLPYMVLERGFTQVIIGTVVAAAGVVLLALAWVLVELRRLKTTLSNAAMAMSVASMVNGATAGDDAKIHRPRPDDHDAALPPSGLAIGGAFAGAGAALAVSRALAVPPQAEAEIHRVQASPGVGDALESAMRDGVDASAAERGQDVDAHETNDLPHHDDMHDDPQEPDAGREPEVDDPAPADPAPSIDPEILTAVETATQPDAPITWPTLHADRPAAEPLAEASTAPALHVEDAPEEGAPADLWAELATPPSAGADIVDPLAPELPPAPSREPDEFGLLRDSLAGLGLAARPGSRIEPSFAEPAFVEPSLPTPSPAEADSPPQASEGNQDHDERQRSDGRQDSRFDEFTAAASWMEPPRRRAPWLSDPRETRPEVAMEPSLSPEPSWPALDLPDREAPPWPPQTRDPLALAPVPDEAFEPDSPAVPAPQPDLATPDDTAAAEAPATSDEGIVGAYQVGEAHFTIYADGSIQARTPDGDYSFTSMDELKIYLASEKSRLGV